MPNPDNSDSPITLLSYGRSGTSLTMSIMRGHPDVLACGETGPMIFGIWQTMERVRGVIRPDPELGGKEAHDARCAKAVRAVFEATFPDEGQPHWFHKPINTSAIFRQSMQRWSTQRQGDWYWNVLNSCFPRGRTLTILRHPYDVVLSSAEYLKADPQGAWEGIVGMAELILHDKSTVDFALSHRRLVEDPEPEITRLLTHLRLSHHPRCYKATERVYVPERNLNRVPKEDMQDHVRRGFSRRDEWHKLDTSKFTDRDRETLVKMWARFGEPLEF